jgi:transposase InsO family protein
VGWHLSDNPGMEGCLEALKKALSTCRDPSGIIHHSDRGIQYCSHPLPDERIFLMSVCIMPIF